MEVPEGRHGTGGGGPQDTGRLVTSVHLGVGRGTLTVALKSRLDLPNVCPSGRRNPSPVRRDFGPRPRPDNLPLTKRE